MKNPREFFSRPLTHRVWLLRFVYAIKMIREADILLGELAFSGQPTDPATTAWVVSAATQVQEDYERLMQVAKELAHTCDSVGLPPEDLQAAYLEAWPERGKLSLPH